MAQHIGRIAGESKMANMTDCWVVKCKQCPRRTPRTSWSPSSIPREPNPWSSRSMAGRLPLLCRSRSSSVRARVEAIGQSAKVAMLGVLDWARRKLIVRTSRTKRSSDFIALLEEVDRRYGPTLGVALQLLVLVLDNGPIHTSKASRAALAARAHWLTVEWLPKYAPELNDIEGVWRDLKRHPLAHQTFTGPDDLDRAIHEAVIKLDAERNRHPLANHRTAA